MIRADYINGTLEPEAERLGVLSGAVLAEALAFSSAISLKRIADALTGKGPSILTAPVNAYGEGIGEAIQGQHERGLRGIPNP